MVSLKAPTLVVLEAPTLALVVLEVPTLMVLEVPTLVVLVAAFTVAGASFTLEQLVSLTGEIPGNF